MINTMKTLCKLVIGISAWGFIGLVTVSSLIIGCGHDEKKIEHRVIEDGLLRNDDLVAIKTSDGKVTIKNETTGRKTIKDIKLDWTQASTRDSLAVFCSEDKRGYYNMYTGEIAIPAKYRRAWVFSEGLAAVQSNGMIGFINHKGETVIEFNYPYHGNPLSSFVFDQGHCVVADSTGKCGVIDNEGEWLIQPVYDDVSAFKEYAIVSKAGVRLQVGYDGKVLNSFVLDSITSLTYDETQRYENRDGEIQFVNIPVNTGLFKYRVGGRCGLMDHNCKRLTEPLYANIKAVDRKMFRALLLDSYSEVILNEKGEVMK